MSGYHYSAALSSGRRKNKKGKESNTLEVTLPSFNQSIRIQFPERSLAVCERCKKNFKTRQHCRTKDCHDGLPWSDTYICITLDHSCLLDDSRQLKKDNVKFVAHTMPCNIPFVYDSDTIDPSTPICTTCKDKNYTRTYCRSNKQHKLLPWSTIHVLLTAEPLSEEQQQQQRPIKRTKVNNEGSANVKANKDSIKEEKEKDDKESKEEKKEKDDKGPKDSNSEKDVKVTKEEKKESTESMESKFDTIPKSRTFLVTISAKKCVIEWLSYDPKLESLMNQMQDSIRMPTSANTPFYGGGGDQFNPHDGYPNSRMVTPPYYGGSAVRGSEMGPHTMPFDAMTGGGHPYPQLPPQYFMQGSPSPQWANAPGYHAPSSDMALTSANQMHHMDRRMHSSSPASSSSRVGAIVASQELMKASHLPSYMWPMATNSFMNGDYNNTGNHHAPPQLPNHHYPNNKDTPHPHPLEGYNNPSYHNYDNPSAMNSQMQRIPEVLHQEKV